MNIIGHKNIFLAVSAVLVASALGAVAVFGFRQGIDFTGGTLWQFKAGSESAGNVKDFFKIKLDLPETIIVFNISDSSFLARLPDVGEEDHGALHG